MLKNFSNTREKKAKLNILISLQCQLITLLCGFIVPGLMINTYGSEAYGATASITQFLAYISLLEGGIGGVARAALYKPLADGDVQRVSEIISEIKRFFRIVAYVFAVYVLILASTYKYISGVEYFDWMSTFVLVLVISISTFAQYFVGISYSVLLQAEQKTYITQTINILGTILNTILIVILVNLKCSLILVKLGSSCVFVLRPIAMFLYVRKHHKFVQCDTRNKNLLEQKWAGLGQHIAYFLHSNIDIVVLTLLSSLTSVAVYSVYNMIISHMQSLIASFSTGMEALFGNMYAKGEIKRLREVFGYYETMISIISVILLSATAVLIIPFIKIYTANITDANYIQVEFGMILLLASIVYCLRSPYHNMIIAAGHFRQTQIAAYGEAVINIVLSIMLVIKYGLIGVAIGTLVATLFRLLYYVRYLEKHILNRSAKLFIKREFINIICFILIYICGGWLISNMNLGNYYYWAFCGLAVVGIASVITLTLNIVLYNSDIREIIGRMNHGHAVKRD